MNTRPCQVEVFLCSSFIWNIKTLNCTALLEHDILKQIKNKAKERVYLSQTFFFFTFSYQNWSSLKKNRIQPWAWVSQSVSCVNCLNFEELLGTSPLTMISHFTSAWFDQRKCEKCEANSEITMNLTFARHLEWLSVHQMFFVTHGWGECKGGGDGEALDPAEAGGHSAPQHGAPALLETFEPPRSSL